MLTQSIKKELGKTAKIIVPLSATNLLQVVSGFLASVMVTRLGRDAIAAAGIVNTTWTLIILVFSIGFLQSIGVLVSQQRGAGNHEAIRCLFRQGIYLACASSLIATSICFFMPSILDRANILTPGVTHFSDQYFYALCWCLPGLILTIAMEQFMVALEQTRLILVINLIQIPCEIILNYGFLFGKWGLPKCGIAGLGYGYAIVFYMADLLILFYLLHSKRIGQTYQLLHYSWRIHWRYLKEMTIVGWPIAAMFGVEAGLFTFTMYIMAHLSTNDLAANQMTLQFLSLTITFAFAIGQTATIRVGHQAGELNLDGVKRAAFASLSISLVAMLCLSMLFWVWPHALLSININKNLSWHSPVIAHVILYLAICGIFQLFDSQRIVLVSILRGLKDTRTPMIISFLSFWVVGLGVGLPLAFSDHLGGEGLWVGISVGIASGMVMLYFRFFRLINKIDLKAVTTLDNNSQR